MKQHNASFKSSADSFKRMLDANFPLQWSEASPVRHHQHHNRKVDNRTDSRLRSAPDKLGWAEEHPCHHGNPTPDETHFPHKISS
jgi:hypothetical protein